MAGDGPIDIMQDFADLYAREEMLAFFDFTIGRGEAPPISGLCRISKPKGSATSSHYLSLTFVIDAPDEATRKAAQEALDQLEPDRVRKALPEIREVITVPTINSGSENYVVQADLLMQAAPGRPFIVQQLVPTIERTTGLKMTDFVWWQTTPSGSAKAAAAPSPEPEGSMVSRLSKYLKQQLGLE